MVRIQGIRWNEYTRPTLIGSSLAHFRILAKLGEGGMGEVYRAEDTRLRREVAIKILPKTFLSEPERIEWFEREARTLASLSHPNVAQVYEVGEEEGIRYIAMELVAGRTLADLLGRGRLELGDSLDVAIQIAEGLAAAHERGVVHRDLKPGNVIVDDQGRVKVVDFGLAKALAPAPIDGESLADSPTLTFQASQEGRIVGTAPYMSPEQVRGKPVDARTDVWAFGCLLYEMLTGRRAFPGETVPDTLGAVVAREPDWSALPRDIPRPVRRVLRRCLAKDRRDRLHHLGDARLDLLDAREARPPDEAPVVVRWSAPPLAVAFALGALLGVGLLWLLGFGLTDPPDTTPGSASSRWTIEVGEGRQLDIGGRLDPLAVSADGRTLAWVARDERDQSRLYLRSVGDLTVREVAGSEGASNPFFSPDGRWLAFFAADQLKKVPVGGGAPVDVAFVPLDNLGATWSEQGTIVFASYSSGLWRVDAEGGEAELLTPEGAAGAVQHRWPSFLPGGQRILYVLQAPDGPRLALFDLATRESRTVSGLQQVVKARYLPSGHLVFAQAGAILAAPFDVEQGRLLDTPVAVLDDLLMDSDVGTANFEIGSGGTLVYVVGEALADGALTWVDRTGEATAAADHRAFFTHPHLSPDGGLLAVEIGSEVGARHIEVFDLVRGTRSVLASEGRNAQPAWHPDGRRVAIVSDRAGNWDLYLVPLAGDRQATSLLVGPLEQWLGTFTPDGSQLVYYQIDPTTARDLWVLDPETAGSARPYRATQANERGVRLSPDGRWLAYVSNESGRDEVHVESFPSRTSRWTVSTSGGTEPVWSRDGRELFYREGQRMMAVPVETAASLDPGSPRLLFEGPYDREIVGNPNYDVAPDGRFLMIRRDEPTSSHFHVALDWAEELGRIVPVPD